MGDGDEEAEVRERSLSAIREFSKNIPRETVIELFETLDICLVQYIKSRRRLSLGRVDKAVLKFCNLPAALSNVYTPKTTVSLVSLCVWRLPGLSAFFFNNKLAANT